MNGLRNSVSIALRGSFKLNLNGVGNDVDIIFQNGSKGSGIVKVNGVGNDVKVHIPKDSDVRLKSVKYDFMNSVEIIKGQDDDQSR